MGELRVCKIPGQTYTWDGNRMRLTLQSDMPECRGSQFMITTWCADAQ